MNMQVRRNRAIIGFNKALLIFKRVKFNKVVFCFIKKWREGFYFVLGKINTIIIGG